MPADDLHAIRNFLALSDRIGTAGQPTAEQFEAIREAGYEVVINLAPPNATYALPDEAEVVAGHRMRYVHIPVRWDSPTLDDARRFFDAMDGAAAEGRKVFVHCAMNMRVSAFMYLYRTVRERLDAGAAAADLHTLWTPNPPWQQFLDAAALELDSGR
jgi:protein tyrosine phosphatase (PTP) superfamily phosphohydrolase (DUF442 family)